MKKILLVSLLLASSLFAQFKTISTEQFEKMTKDGVLIIDIRRAQEWKQTGVIKGSIKNTFFDNKGKYDVNKWMGEFTKYVKDRNQPVILVCARANRTKVVGKFLDQQVGMKNVYDLEGGITKGWISKGKQTVK